MELLQYLIGIPALRDKQLPISLSYLHATKVMHELHVVHLKLCCKVLLARFDELLITCQYEIIYIKYNDQQLTFHHYVIQVHIYFTLCEAQPSEVDVYPSVPRTRCLLQPIQRSLESAHM